MLRWAASALLSLAIAACADVQPRQYRLEVRTKGVTSFDIQSIVTMAQHFLHGSAPVISPQWPIYIVRFKSPREAEVRYGDPNAYEKNFLIFARRTDGWHHTGYGVDLRPQT